MNWQNVDQEGAAISNVLNVRVIGAGYYYLVKLYREWIRRSKEERTAGGRPMVVVSADYSRLPNVGTVVRNFNKAPAKEASFAFSAPVVAPDGLVVSDLPYLKKGLPFLEPEGQISHLWGRLPDLAPVLRERGLEDGIRLTTSYKDLAGESYETEWTLDPLLFEGCGIGSSKRMTELADAVEKIPGSSSNDGGRRGRSGENERYGTTIRKGDAQCY
ncbi:hypothetical protein GBA65_07340 [Rubrobacter marinus]|uniref:Uncharacterized protein n=1 Tax=Rubrobacter marinus TaxID=2653852 RepID=A0A6G8PW31_9ACTN|nr:hypothetical protein [Rubrobacter marinus]QIN78367.1 hypothetical protein GBA65_07340 [Rubrobacter marinus]